MTKGVIALDIDGTVTSKGRDIPGRTLAYLTALHEEGWQLVFITGRNFSWGSIPLRQLAFPYLFGVQNGATLLSMPDEVVLASRYLDVPALAIMEQIVDDEETGVVLYSGFENQDICYYRPDAFSPRLLEYLRRRLQVFQESWRPLESFDELSLRQFSSLKCFGERPLMERVAHRVEQELGLHMPVIRDPFDPSICVGQATHPEGSKGGVIDHLREQFGPIPIVAAGDDYNDLGMLKAADVAIAMGSAPDSLLRVANIQAPAAEEEGIVQGLERALHLITGKEAK